MLLDGSSVCEIYFENQYENTINSVSMADKPLFKCNTQLKNYCLLSLIILPTSISSTCYRPTSIIAQHFRPVTTYIHEYIYLLCICMNTYDKEIFLDMFNSRSEFNSSASQNTAKVSSAYKNHSRQRHQQKPLRSCS